MKPSLQSNCIRQTLIVFLLTAFSFAASAQTETFSTGSFIINMGATNPNTIANGLKPYGLIYDLIRNYSVPIKCVINPDKVKDGVDFTYNGVQYKGGTFVIKSEFRSAAVNARITYWTGQGVVGATTTSAMTLNITKTIVSVPRWTLDAQNGKIAEGFLLNAGINNTAFPGAYNWKAPSLLACCDDYFVIPHADPTWAVHGHLWSWNKDCYGAIWGGCHAVSVLENMSNPSNPVQKTNFLSTTGLLLFSSHGNGSPPYNHQYPADPVAQYLGKTDLAMQNGSEQCFMPRPGGAWNPGTTIIAYDPSQADVPSKSPGPAVVIIYGRGMDDPNRGYVMYEASHNINNNSAGSVAAQRAFFNFSFYNTLYKIPQLAVTGIIDGQQIPGSSTVTGLHITASSILTGMTFTYQWTSTCGGSFSNSTGATTNFTAPAVGSASSCVITCKVTDNCGRSSFSAFIIILGPGSPPIANNDVASIDPGCGTSASITTNVLANDSDPDGRPITLTQVNGNNGSFTTVNGGFVNFNAAGNITYSSAAGFTGAETLTYKVCDNTSPTPLCSNATYTITVGDPANVPNASNDAYTVAEDAIDTFNVLANDVPVVSGPITVSAIYSGPSNGKVSVNTDNTITYVPNADFAGTDNFTYSIVNALGYTRTASVTVTVTNDACDAGTYQLSTPLTVSNTVTFNPTNDNSLDQNAPSKNNGASTTIIVDGQTNQALRPTLKFDLSSIPAGATITSASLQMVATAVASNSAENVEVHQMTRDWLEGTGSNTAGSPNWTQYSGASTWTTPGGDFNGTAESTTSVSTTGTYTWSVTNMVNTWYTTPVNNFGMLLKFAIENTGNQNKTFGSKENATTANKPVLSVTYTTTGTSGSIVLDATDDSYSYEGGKTTIWNPDDNYVGNFTAASATRMNDMLKFPVNGSTLPAGSHLTSSSLTLSVSSTSLPVGGMTVSAYEITQDWLESQMTWNNRKTATPWTTPGGTFNATVQASATVLPASASSTWGLTNLVQGWITTPANNFGVLLKDPGNQIANAYYLTYYDKDVNTIASLKPKLTLNWSSVNCLAIPARAPLGNQDTATTISVTPVTFNVLNNDNLFGQAATGLTISTAPIAAQGSATANIGAGTVTFTPNPAFNGVATFQYTVTTANGSDVVRVYVRVNNSPVVANNDNPAGQYSGVVQTISVLANDVDPEGAALSVTIVSQPSKGTAILNGSNQVVYTPNSGFTGTDTLTYQVCEPALACGNPYCATATVIITVLNRAPIANNDTKTGLPCQAVRIDLVTNDTDPEGNALSVTNISALSNPAAGVLADNNDGTVTFIPALGFLGVVTFTYTVTDNGITPATSAPATATVTIAAAVNNPPVAVNDVADSSNMDENLFYSVRDNDYDPDENALTIPVITVNPLHGTATVLSNGLVKYTPNPGFFGNDILTYQICDIVLNPATCSGVPGLCATATLSITVRPRNSTNAINDQNSTWINTPVSGGVLINDFDLQGDAIVFTGFLDNPGVKNTSGSITVSGMDNGGNPVANAGTLSINSDGTYVYTPANDFTGVVTVPYTISDNNPNAAIDTAFLKITVNQLKAVANSVISNNDENLSYGNPVSGNVLVNDRDPQGDAFGITGFKYDTDGDGTADGTGTPGTPVIIGGITVTGVPVSYAGTLVLNANGDYTFSPAPDFHGMVDVPYTICDNGSPVACSISILHIDVLPDLNGPLNDPPFNGDDFLYTDINVPVSTNFVQNDNDPNGDPISINGITINTAGPHTTIVSLTTLMGGTMILFADGTCTYTPAINFSGPDQVNYQVCDVTLVNPQPLCSSGTLYMLVAPGPLLPINLLSFTGRRSGKDNLLQWSTAQESNSHHIEVENRTDNSVFAKIGTVTAKGNSSVRTDYSFVHQNPPLVVNYYRLKLVDIDGKFNYSKTIAIKNEGTGVTINSVYPNPFSDKVELAVTFPTAEKFTLNLYDVSGKLVRTSIVMAASGFNTITLSGLRNLASGMFFLEIKSNEETIRTKLFKTY